MHRFNVLLVTAAVALSATACENRAAREQEKAAEAQREANEKAARASNEATTEITSAQIEANKKIAEANANFQKIREDYRHKLQSDLNDVNKDIAELEAKSARLTGKAKADLDVLLQDVRARRDAFTTDYNTLDTSSAATWDGMKDRVDHDWDALKDSLRKAKAKL